MVIIFFIGVCVGFCLGFLVHKTEYGEITDKEVFGIKEKEE